MEKVFFVLNNILLFSLSNELIHWLLPGFSPRHRTLAVFSLCPILAALLLLGLGLAGYLTAGACTTVLGIAVFLVMGRRYFSGVSQAADADEMIVQEPSAQNLVSETYSKIAWMLLGLNLIVILELLIRGNGYTVDDLSYHLTAAVHWLKDQRLSLAPMNYHAYYPFNAELLTLWMILPFRSDGMVFLVGVYWLILTVWATGELVYVISREKTVAILACTTLLTTATVVIGASNCSANDLAPSACILTGFLLAQIYRPANNREQFCLCLFAALLAGLAVGMRVAYVPAGILLGLFLMSRTNSRPERASRGCVFLIGFLILGGFWYIRNYLLTGNPLFPAEVGPFSGPFDSASQAHTRLITKIDWSKPRELAAVFKTITNWPYSYFLISLAGYVLAGYYLIKRRIDTESRGLFLFLSVVGCIAAIHFPFLPFSGTDNGADAHLRIDRRFLLFPFLIGIILFYSAILQTKNVLWRRIFLSLGILLLFLKGPLFPGYNLEGLVLGFLFIIFVEYDYLTRLRIWCIRRTAILIVAVVPLLAIGYPYWQNRADNRIRTLLNRDRSDQTIFQALDTLPAGSRIAFFGTDSYQYYPLFGRRFQLAPVLWEPDGTPWSPLHLRWRQSSETMTWWSSAPETSPTVSEFVDRLSEQKIRYVLVQKGETDWPIQQTLLQNASNTNAICKSSRFILWEIEGNRSVSR